MLYKKSALKFIPLVVIAILLLTLLFSKDIKLWANKLIYNKNKSDNNLSVIPKEFTELDIYQVQKKIENGDSFFLYTGRDTCRYCRVIIPILNKIYSKLEIELLYLNSEYTDVDAQIQEFRTQYEIEFVPSLIKFDDNSYKIIDLNLFLEDNTYNYSSLYKYIKNLD